MSNIQITESQAAFVFSNAVCPAIIGGLGSGKTRAGTFRTVYLMTKDPGINIGYYLPTYDLIKLRGIPGLETDLRAFGFRDGKDFQTNKSEYITHIFGYGDVIFRSYERPERIVAYEVAHSIVDELDTIPPEKAELIWQRVSDRNRQLCNHLSGNTVGCVTTPNYGKKGFCYKKWGDNPQDGYEYIKASTYDNPFLPKDYAANIEKNYPPELARLFLNGDWVSLDGQSLFAQESLLVDGFPVKSPVHCDYILAIMDTAVKSGVQHDGTGVIYCAYNPRLDYSLIVLDYDYVQIDGAYLEAFIPSVFDKLQELAKQCGARLGVSTFIEDRQAGSVLLQQCQKHQREAKTIEEFNKWKTLAIPDQFVAMGKEGRAIDVSGLVYQGKVKFSEHAFNKVVPFKGDRKNHLWVQVVDFVLGSGVGSKALSNDDLLDTFCYAIQVALKKIG